MHLRGRGVTSDQERARSLIARIEGTNLECHQEGDRWVIKSELGAIYTVDRDAEFIWRNGWTKPRDLSDLEMEADDPMFGAANPLDQPDHNEGAVEAPGALLTDLDEESRADLRAEAQRVEQDREFYRRQEAA